MTENKNWDKTEKGKKWHKEYYRKWREKNKEKLNKKARDYYKENPERVKKWRRKWRKNNPEKVNEYKRKWKKHRRLKLRFQILQRNKWACHYCGRKSPEVVLEIDHRFPKSKGGKNNIKNYITSCRECNLGKGDIILDEFN